MNAFIRVARLSLPAVLAVVLAGCGGALMNRGGGGESAPGLYNLEGWGYWAGDVNGQVGYPLGVGGPTASCRPSGTWSLNTSVVSGALPPGLSIGDGGAIGGIPTERGHWIVRLRAYNIQCNGTGYDGFEQELRFHITGSGQVIQ